MTFRGSVLAWFLLVALVTVAQAAPTDIDGWNGVRWGMTVSAVQARFPSGKLLLGSMLTVENVAAAPGVKPGYAVLIFERKDKTLRRVSLMPGTSSDAKPGKYTAAEVAAIRADLTKRCGGAAMVGDLARWTLPRTAITLTATSVEYSATTKK